MRVKKRAVNQRAVCYARVSTVGQAQEGVSLEHQEGRLKVYCAAQGLELVKVFREEGVSASVPLRDRPLGQELLAELKTASHVVSLKLDRLFRSAVDALQQTAEWDKQGISLHLTDFAGSALNSSSATGRMMLTMLGAFAEFERNLIAERTSAALRHKRSNLQVFNHAPYGYQSANGMLIPDETEQQVIRSIQEQRSAGHTLSQIAEKLNDTGVPTKRSGGRWYPSTVTNILNSALLEKAS